MLILFLACWALDKVKKEKSDTLKNMSLEQVVSDMGEVSLLPKLFAVVRMAQ